MEGDCLEGETELSLIQQQGIDVVQSRLQHETELALVYCWPGSAWLGDVEREVRVYMLGVSDPMLRSN